MVVIILIRKLTLSLPESVMESFQAVLSFECVDDILWCDGTNETSSAVLLNGTVYICVFYKMKFGIRLEF